MEKKHINPKILVANADLNVTNFDYIFIIHNRFIVNAAQNALLLFKQINWKILRTFFKIFTFTQVNS